MLGTCEDGEIKLAKEPVITCQCIRVPVLNGHTAAVFVKFRKKPTKEQLIEKLESFRGAPQDLELPSAPKQFIQDVYKRQVRSERSRIWSALRLARFRSPDFSGFFSYSSSGFSSV